MKVRINLVFISTTWLLSYNKHEIIKDNFWRFLNWKCKNFVVKAPRDAVKVSKVYRKLDISSQVTFLKHNPTSTHGIVDKQTP